MDMAHLLTNACLQASHSTCCTAFFNALPTAKMSASVSSAVAHMCRLGGGRLRCMFE